MANEQNLKPSEYKLSQEEAKKGGANSGKSRRQKADMRKAAQTILDGEYSDKSGTKKTGSEILILTLFKIATDPKNKQCISAAKTLIELTNQNKSNEEISKLIAEIDKIKAETELTQAKTNLLTGNKEENDNKLNELIEALKDV